MENRRDLKPASYRLSEEARDIIRYLARRKGISMTSVLEVVLREEAKREGYEPKPTPPTEDTP